MTRSGNPRLINKAVAATPDEVNLAPKCSPLLVMPPEHRVARCTDFDAFSPIVIIILDRRSTAVIEVEAVSDFVPA